MWRTNQHIAYIRLRFAQSSSEYMHPAITADLVAMTPWRTPLGGMTLFLGFRAVRLNVAAVRRKVAARRVGLRRRLLSVRGRRRVSFGNNGFGGLNRRGTVYHNSALAKRKSAAEGIPMRILDRVDFAAFMLFG